MECQICCEEYDAIFSYRCDKCNQTECLKCFQSFNKEECPFCRYSPNPVVNSVENVNIYSQTYPGNYYVPYYETSRILTRQLRRERKRQEHELQQIRNAELSRIHNNNIRKTKKSKEKRQDIQFQIDDL